MSAAWCLHPTFARDCVYTAYREVFTRSAVKMDRNRELMYSIGSVPPTAHYCAIGNRGENTGKPLDATENDVELISDTFKRLEMRPIIEKNYRKMTKKDVENILDQVALTDVNNCPCLVFYYSGHGKDCGIHLDDGGTYPFKTIVEHITSLPALLGKPKVFLFDCCRVYDYNVEHCKDRRAVETCTDCIIAYSCSKGEEAYISNMPYITNHSVFTKYLCLMLSAHYWEWSLVSILTHSNRLIQKSMDRFYSQNPQVIINLKKQLYLCCKYYLS